MEEHAFRQLRGVYSGGLRRSTRSAGRQRRRSHQGCATNYCTQPEQLDGYRNSYVDVDEEIGAPEDEELIYPVGQAFRIMANTEVARVDLEGYTELYL